MHTALYIAIVATASALSLSSLATAQPVLVVKPLAERKVAELPPGPLFWRIENFADVAQAHAAAGPLALVATSSGKVWLFTLGPPGGSSPGGARVAEVGPVQRPAASQYLLRINEASGETSSHTPGGVKQISAGQTETGNSADTPMQVSSSGSADLHSLVMFVVDATKPFSSPAKLP